MDKLWNFLGSTRLAIVLFLILACFSIFGTLIPQGQPYEFYVMKYGESLGKIINFFKLYDAYYSWWFVGTLFFFLANLIVCSIKRFSTTWKLYKKDPTQINLEHLPNKYEIELKVSLSQITEILSNKLKFKKVEGETKGGILFYKDLNRWAYFSVYIVHLSIIIIIIGALIGSIWGYRGSMSIVEGKSSNNVLPFRDKNPIFLDFFVKLNKFNVELYPDGTPKEYISNVTIIDGNRTFSKAIKVNSPLRYKGLSFYQESYETIPVFRVKVKYNGNEKIYSLDPFSPVDINNRYTLALSDFGEAHGLIYARVVLFDSETNQQIPGIIIKGIPHFRIPLDKGELEVLLEDVQKVIYVSILQVKKDPGVSIVYAGFILSVLGLLGVYFFEPKTFWIFVSPSEKDKLTLQIGAYAKRERETLKLKVERIVEKINALLRS